MPVIEFESPASVFDPLMVRAELPLRSKHHLLGFGLELETNSSLVVEAAAQSWPAAAELFADPPIRLSIGVKSEDLAAPTPPPVFRSRGHLLSIVSGPEDSMVCDFRCGFGFGWLRGATAADPAFFRYHFLEAAALSMLEQRSLASVHGAAVAHSGKGILLCGESFAGKSTLAYACARAGWTLVSDDATYFVRSRTDLFAVGHSHVLRFRPDAPLLFPELAGRSVATRPNGKPGIEVFTKDLNGIQTAPGAAIHHVVFLDRSGRGPARLGRYSPGEKFTTLTSAYLYGQDDVRAEQMRTYERLAQRPTWRLTYSNLDEAVARLDALVADGM